MHNPMGFWSAVWILFLVMDPLGNIPMFVTLLKKVPASRVVRIVLREHLIALAIFFFFILFGRFFLDMLGIKDPTLSISGGIVLFLIAIKMIFPMKEGVFGDLPDGEPFIVPLATPLICGPSALSTVLILTSKENVHLGFLSLGLLAAWGASLAILSRSFAISKLLGLRGVTAIERLMGMILTTIAVQMFLTGLAQFMQKAG